MLAEGGLPIVTDSLRKADDDNPNGYFEIEQSKALKGGESRWLYSANGKVVKIISYLLEYLPSDIEFDVVFMERNLDEILASQKKMLLNRDEETVISDDEMSDRFFDHVKAVKYWIARKPNMRVIYVSYSEMVNSPEVLCNSLVEFLDLPLNLQAMQSVPSQSLYRNRA